MKISVFGAVLGFASFVCARQCQNITVPVTISAVNGVYNVKAPVTNIDVTNFILNLTQPGKNFPASVQTGNKTIHGTYKLAATLCNPDKGQSDTVQLLTHGIGFDRSYWDLPFNNYNYSYVSTAVDQYHYSTFTWDRLGIGMSQHGNPINEIQAQLEVSALYALTTLLRSGKIESYSKPFKKVVHVGHSFGSEHTYALTQQHPTSSDGIVLTGFSQDGTYVPYFALGGNFIQANTLPALASYPNGYLAASDASAVQTNFFAPNQFDPAILAYATATGQPVTVGELLTIGSETALVNHFKGPVLVITGERDIPYCGGNCLVPLDGFANIPAAAQKSFPQARFAAVVVPNAGHGLNLEFGHASVYQTVNQFFVRSVGV